MSIEVPVLRLGIAGFAADQQGRLSEILARAASSASSWQLGVLSDADGLWVNGSRTHLLANGTLRISSGIPSGRSVQLNLPEITRPVAFSVPLGPGGFEPAYLFDIDSPGSMRGVLAKFESCLGAVTAQFCLASQLLEHERALGSGSYHVSAGSTLLAVVDLQGEVGVLPTAGARDFENAMWSPRPASAGEMPAAFVRTSLAQLMWRYAVRTRRDVLPRHYQTATLYFRRPPGLPQRLLNDSHLLLLRELASEAANFDDLRQRTGLGAPQLSQHLAALYLVGAITANPKRAAAVRAPRRADAPDSAPSLPHSVLPSGPDSQPATSWRAKRSGYPDLTAPASMSLE